MKTPLTLSDFHYALPDELVAQHPLAERDEAKLLLWEDQKISHHQVKDLDKLIPKGSLFIVNDSKVIASRIRFNLPTGGNAEFLLLEPVASSTSSSQTHEDWYALGRPTRKFRVGTRYDVGNGLTVEIISLPGDTLGSGPSPLTIRVSKHGLEFLDWLKIYGEMPLPPYIERQKASVSTTTEDKLRYQTVYAGALGSVAAPTAGLHFTDQVMENLKQQQCTFAKVTLHVGAGTFLPVKTPDISQHTMHDERFLVPRATLNAIASAKAEKRPVIVVGTTTLRSLEGLNVIAREHDASMETFSDQWLRTKIFIRPEFIDSKFEAWAPDALMTNFHQPESTLLMLVSALLGYEQIQNVYRAAIEQQYRFFSYGDSSLLWLKGSST